MSTTAPFRRALPARSTGTASVVSASPSTSSVSAAISALLPGGRTFGYATVEESFPPDPEHPRRIPVVDEAEAETVRRIFVSFVAGKSPRVIAGELSRAGVPAPHDGGKGHKGVRGCDSRRRGVARSFGSAT
jgi:hypothetical protein